MDITSVTGQGVTSLTSKLQESFGQLTLKPICSFGCANILSKFWYIGAPGNFFGFEMNRQLFYSGVVGVTSAIESTLRQYILPNSIRDRLIAYNLVDMTSPIVVGLSNLLFHEIQFLYNYRGLMMDKNVLWSFLFGFISEICGMYLYNNVIAKISE